MSISPMQALFICIIAFVAIIALWYNIVASLPQNYKVKHSFLRIFCQRNPRSFFRLIQTFTYFFTRDFKASLAFLRTNYSEIGINYINKIKILFQFGKTTFNIRGFHSQSEMLHAVDTIFHLAQSKLHEQIVNENDVFCIVECGVASGSSTAKLTYASRIMQDSINKKRKDRQKLEIKYFALDSYCGIPTNSEVHRQISFGVVNECQISEEQESKIINDKQQSRERSVIAQPQPSPWRFRDANCASNEKDKESKEQIQLLRKPIQFYQGSFRGNLQSVKRVVEKYGCIDICTFIKGWFDDTIYPKDADIEQNNKREKINNQKKSKKKRQRNENDKSENENNKLNIAHIDVALIDVDLISSARTCISRIYPHLCAGGIILSQDGHLLAHIELLENKEFLDELDTSAKEQFKTSFETQDIERVSFYPIVEGLRQRKFIEIRMPK